jgi:enamine deaminase RidA (YjgF/YER057c/UK114 family)
MTRQIEFLNPPELMKPVGFSHAAATRGGRTIFLSGQVAKDRDGRVVGKGDIVAQFRQVCENLKTLVTAAGGQLTDVVKLTIRARHA